MRVPPRRVFAGRPSKPAAADHGLLARRITGSAVFPGLCGARLRQSRQEDV